MKRNNRLHQILDILEKTENVTAEQLALKYNVSASTIRRDFQKLDDMGLIERYYGGVSGISEHFNELPMSVKETKNAHNKRRIAKYAASLIQNNQLVYLDAGSTSLEMIDYITAKNIVVVTIGIPHIERLMAKGISTIVLGGTVRPTTLAITGKQVIDQMENYHFDISFIGCNGIHPSYGLSTTNDSEAYNKRMAIKQSTKAYALGSLSKFNTLTPNPFAKINEVTIITDSKGDFEAAGLKCIEVDNL